jgi:hemerythrin-like domain-containing protein
MTASTNIRQRARELVDQLTGESLSRAVEFLETLPREADRAADLEEESLLQIIHRRLSEDDQARLSYLRQRNEDGEITETEHQELLTYVDRVEQQDVERAEALVRLAQVRQVDLKSLLNEFPSNLGNA